MKAAFYTANGGPSVLQYGDVPDPVLDDHSVLIRVETIALEGGDTLHRRTTPPKFVPYVGGYQAAGTIEKLGAAVTRFRVGQRVVGFHWRGSHAELWAPEEQHVFLVPEGLDLDIAATIPITFGTASDALFEFGHLQKGETVLIQGAAGGVGIAAVQLAHHAGARVIATASGAERRQRLSEFGADEIIDYRSEDIAERCLALTQGKGVDLVLDMAGGQSVEALIKSLRYRGRYVLIGAASGTRPSFAFSDILYKSLTVQGVLFGSEIGTPRGQKLVNDLLAQARAGTIKMPIDRIFPLSEAVQCHEYVETGHPFGRVLMKP